VPVFSEPSKVLSLRLPVFALENISVGGFALCIHPRRIPVHVLGASSPSTLLFSFVRSSPQVLIRCSSFFPDRTFADVGPLDLLSPKSSDVGVLYESSEIPDLYV